MALTAFQRRVCKLLEQARIDSGESYVAGGAALNELPSAPASVARHRPLPRYRRALESELERRPRRSARRRSQTSRGAGTR